MRADAFLAAAEALPLVGLELITQGRGVVVIAPHPDDESLGCGGLIAASCAIGLAVRLIVLSDGVGSHPNSVSHPPERLRDLREAETLQAVKVLGLAAENVSFLRLPDRYVASSGAHAQAAAADIVAMARECDAGALVVTWAHDPHCDHVAAAAIARIARERMPAIRILEYPVWGWTLPPDIDTGAEPYGARLDISRHLQAKLAAVAAHRSQTTNLIDDDPEGFRLDAEMLARFARPFEIYLDVTP